MPWMKTCLAVGETIGGSLRMEGRAEEKTAAGTRIARR
jgi:hypothetical protein